MGLILEVYLQAFKEVHVFESVAWFCWLEFSVRLFQYSREYDSFRVQESTRWHYAFLVYKQKVQCFGRRLLLSKLIFRFSEVHFETGHVQGVHITHFTPTGFHGVFFLERNVMCFLILSMQFLFLLSPWLTHSAATMLVLNYGTTMLDLRRNVYQYSANLQFFHVRNQVVLRKAESRKKITFGKDPTLCLYSRLLYILYICSALSDYRLLYCYVLCAHFSSPRIGYQSKAVFKDKWDLVGSQFHSRL